MAPFYEVTGIFNDQNTFHNRLNESYRDFTAILILTEWDYSRVQTYVQQYTNRFLSVKFVHIFFIRGGTINMLVVYNNVSAHCYSIKSDITSNIRNICAIVNGRNIDYCEQHRCQHERQKDIGLANMYAIQKYDRVNIDIAYNERLQREWEN